MTRIILASGFFLLMMILIISSLSHGVLSRLGHLTRREAAGLMCVICLGSASAWLFFSGEFDYLLWLYDMPARPADEKAFVEQVERSRAAWSLEATSAARATVCKSETARLASVASSVDNWVGTISTTYNIGTGAALVVRIGKYVVLRTPYNGAEGGSFIARGTPTFEQISTLSSGDPVSFSGKVAGSSARCMFDVPSSSDDANVELLFDFTAVKPA